MEIESAQTPVNTSVNQETQNVNENLQPQEEKQTSKSLNLNFVLLGVIVIFLIIGAAIFLSGNKMDSIKNQFIGTTTQNNSSLNNQNSSVSSLNVDAEIKKAGEALVELDSSISNVDQGLNDKPIDLSQ